VNVLLGPTGTVNATLEVAKVSSEIKVADEAPLVEAENGDVSATMNQRQISEVPNPGNDLTYVAQTAPGAIMQTDIQANANFSILGMSGMSYLYTIDGMNDNENGVNFSQSGALFLLLGQNQIQEATVVSTGYSGQFGGAAGGNLNYVTKSGGNAFHGNAQYYWNGRALNANDWFLNAFDKPRPFDNTGPGGIDVLLGNGKGTLLAALEYPGTPNVYSASLAIEDFNGDGVLDLAVSNTSDNQSGSGLNLFWGKGDGTFQPVVNYAAGSNPYAVAIAAFNSNGRLDLATPNPASSTVSVLLQPPLVSGPDAVFSPSSLTFATQLVGTTSPAESVLLTNYGTAALSITSIVPSGNFGETETCTSSLAPGESCPIDVTFTPGVEGPLSGTLSVADDAPGSPQTAILNGTVVTLSPTSMAFFCSIVIGYHGQPHCMRSRSGTAMLTNTGSTSLTISDIAITGPFSETNTCAGSVAAGQSCSIGVTWNHSSGGGLLSISDNGGGSPQTVSLSGIAQCKP
jgi:hypothetical protein